MALLWRAPWRKRLVRWPESVDERLEALVRFALAAGEQASFSQVLGALVATADPNEISQQIREYRRLDEDEFRSRIDPSSLPEVNPPGPRRSLASRGEST